MEEPPPRRTSQPSPERSTAVAFAGADQPHAQVHRVGAQVRLEARAVDPPPCSVGVAERVEHFGDI